MAFFEDLTKKVQDVAFTAAEKAQEVAAIASEKASNVADRAKSEYAIAAEKRSLDKNYRAVGEWYLSTIEEAPEAVADIVSAIRASQAKIAELEASRPVKEEAPAAEAEEPAEVKTCPNCGAAVTSKFCPECGTEV